MDFSSTEEYLASYFIVKLLPLSHFCAPTQSWILEEKQLTKIPANKIGHFYSDKVHIVYYEYEKQVSLHTRKEGVVYVWVGSKVSTSGEKVVLEVLEQLPTVNVDLEMVSEGFNNLLVIEYKFAW